MNNEILHITFPDGSVHQVEYGTEVGKLIEKMNLNPDLIRAAKINNKVYSLDKELRYDSKIEPVMANSKTGADVYRRSLCFVLGAASHKLYPESRLIVGPSVDYGYYYTLETGSEMKEEEVKAIENEMRNMIKAGLPIETKIVSYEQAVELFKNSGLQEGLNQLDFICPPHIRVNKLQDFYDFSFGTLVTNTSLLKTFELFKYQNGFLLRFPRSKEPETIRPFHDQPKLFELYQNYKNWGKQLGVTAVSDLNRLIIDRKVNDFIDITETFQQKCISYIASQIKKRQTARVVLIAGPSSSGKTTTSKKLTLELQAIGYRPKVISLDCYYVGRDRTPKDENGEYDFECLEALDVELLNQNLVDLFAGKEVIIPSYDFHTGTQKFDKKNTMKLEENEILIMEGIHGLNPKLTPKIPEDKKFKIYLSALTQLNLDDHNRISTGDNRLIRRIVRDYQFRGKNAAGTIAMWQSVRNGEEKHIFPFLSNADAVLNTALDYELSVLKVYAEPLLRCVKPTEPEYGKACSLLSFLDNFATIAPTQVPDRSIIREFIGGSAFKY